MLHYLSVSFNNLAGYQDPLSEKKWWGKPHPTLTTPCIHRGDIDFC